MLENGADTEVVTRRNFRYSCPIATKTGICPQSSLEPNIATCGQTDNFEGSECISAAFSIVVSVFVARILYLIYR
jgi:hypothetical protein